MHPLYDLRETGMAERMREADVRAARHHLLMDAASGGRPARQASQARPVGARLRRALRAFSVAR
jgi:hypothetical protein